MKTIPLASVRTAVIAAVEGLRCFASSDPTAVRGFVFLMEN